MKKIEPRVLRTIVISLEMLAWLLLWVALLSQWRGIRLDQARPTSRAFYAWIVMGLTCVFIKTIVARRLGEIDARGLVFHHRVSLLQTASTIFIAAFVPTMTVPFYNGMHDHQYHSSLAMYITQYQQVPLPKQLFGGIYPYLAGQHTTVAQLALFLGTDNVMATARGVLMGGYGALFSLSAGLIALAAGRRWFPTRPPRYAGAALASLACLFFTDYGRWLSVPSSTPFALSLVGFFFAVFFNILPEVRGRSMDALLPWSILATITFCAVLVSHHLSLFVLTLMLAGTLAVGWVFSRIPRFGIEATRHHPARPYSYYAFLAFGFLAALWYLFRMAPGFDHLVEQQFRGILGSSGSSGANSGQIRSPAALPHPREGEFIRYGRDISIAVTALALLQGARRLFKTQTNENQRRQLMTLGALAAGYLVLQLVFALVPALPRLFLTARWAAYFVPVCAGFIGLAFTIRPPGSRSRLIRVGFILAITPVFVLSAATTVHLAAADTQPILPDLTGQLSRSYVDSELAAIQWLVTYLPDGQRVSTDSVPASTLGNLYTGERRGDIGVRVFGEATELLRPRSETYLIRHRENDERALLLAHSIIHRFEPGLLELDPIALRPIYDSDSTIIYRRAAI